MGRIRNWAILAVWASCFLGIALARIVGGISFSLTPLGDWLGYFLPLFVVFRFTRGRRFWDSVGVKREGLSSGFLWLLALFLLFSFLIALYGKAVAWILGKDPAEEVFERMKEELPTWYFVYFALASFLPVALVEEVTFRGFILRELLPMGAVKAILLSSLMHSLSHLWYAELGVLGLSMFGSAFLFSLWMGMVYVKTGNLVAPIFMHGLNNFSISLRFFLGEEVVEVLSLFLLFFGWLSLLYLLFFRRGEVRREEERKEERLRAREEGLRKMMERLDSFRREGKISEEEWRRLKEVYRARLEELERERKESEK